MDLKYGVTAGLRRALCLSWKLGFHEDRIKKKKSSVVLCSSHGNALALGYKNRNSLLSYASALAFATLATISHAVFSRS